MLVKPRLVKSSSVKKDILEMEVETGGAGLFGLLTLLNGGPRAVRQTCFHGIVEIFLEAKARMFKHG